MLPKSMPELVYTKVAGCLFTLGPALFYMGLGAMMYPAGMADFFDNIVTESWFWVMLFVYGFFLHLTALLSLYVKWGALPLAIGLMIFGYIFFGMAVSLVFMLISPSLSWFGDGDVIAVLFAIFFLGLNIAMEFAIGMRLRQLAAR
ncbi:MAG: hypothetical protein HON53_00895 [Planctomycetaceae bacterium]|nr:hypothetical protein [Planctomycetaceae bacterium]